MQISLVIAHSLSYPSRRIFTWRCVKQQYIEVTELSGGDDGDADEHDFQRGLRHEMNIAQTLR